MVRGIDAQGRTYSAHHSFQPQDDHLRYSYIATGLLYLDGTNS